jgi:hypothetical protein
MRLTTYCNRKVGSEWTTVETSLSPPLAALVTSRNTRAFMTVGEAGAGQAWVKPPRSWKIIPLAPWFWTSTMRTTGNSSGAVASSDTLSSNPEKNEKKLDKAVGRMLEHFPPHEKG